MSAAAAATVDVLPAADGLLPPGFGKHHCGVFQLAAGKKQHVAHIVLALGGALNCTTLCYHSAG